MSLVSRGGRPKRVKSGRWLVRGARHPYWSAVQFCRLEGFTKTYGLLAKGKDEEPQDSLHIACLSCSAVELN